MRRALLCLAGLLVIGGLVAGSAAAQTATAELRNAQGEAVGSATLTEGPQGANLANGS